MNTNLSLSERTAMLSRYGILRSRQTRGSRIDIVLVDKNEDVCHIIDVACPGDSRIVQKEEEKGEK